MPLRENNQKQEGDSEFIIPIDKDSSQNSEENVLIAQVPVNGVKVSIPESFDEQINDRTKLSETSNEWAQSDDF